MITGKNGETIVLCPGGGATGSRPPGWGKRQPNGASTCAKSMFLEDIVGTTRRISSSNSDHNVDNPWVLIGSCLPTSTKRGDKRSFCIPISVLISSYKYKQPGSHRGYKSKYEDTTQAITLLMGRLVFLNSLLLFMKYQFIFTLESSVVFVDSSQFRIISTGRTDDD